jgi:fatty acid desaturase
LARAVPDRFGYNRRMADATSDFDATRVAARAAVEVPTLALIVAVYGGWLAVTYQYGRWPLWVVAPLAAVLLVLHSSLQHEILHGHPTRWRPVNRLFALAPLSLWLPYERYRHNHLIHHINDRLTDPLDDPESYYLTPDAWAKRGAFGRRLVQVQQTLAGRVLLGSFLRIGRFLLREGRALLANQPRQRSIWLEHFAWCVPVILWVKVVCGMPLWLYVVAVVVPGNGILLIRSFAEHRARPAVRERTAIVERSWILGPLYLFNNLHALHHEEPLMPWYDYNARYRQVRDRLIAANGGLLYRTYFDVARRYLFSPHDTPQHPTGRAPGARPAQAGSP